MAGEMRYWRGRLRLAAGDAAQAPRPTCWKPAAALHAPRSPASPGRADAALADLYHNRGDTVAQATARANARGGIARLVEGVRDKALRRSFLGRADAQEVLTT